MGGALSGCEKRRRRGAPDHAALRRDLNPTQPRAAAERAARESYGKLLAYLAIRCGHVDVAEDALSDAFVAALERWPRDGVPRAPEAWLLVAARNRLLDTVRHGRREVPVVERLAEAARAAQLAFERADGFADERLGLLFACAHPAIAVEMRAPLLLQVVLGVDAARIAACFLVAPTTMSQRLVRAKRKIAAAGIPLRVPSTEAMSDRLDGVLAAVYATFGIGWDDPVAADPAVRGLAVEAIELGRFVAAALPGDPEAAGLLALMLHAGARRPARRDGSAYVPLERQDPARWDAAAIAEAEAELARAARLGRIGRYQLEAAIQSAHAVRRFGRTPDWAAIVMLYDALLRLTNSPVVALNRAVALGRLHGAARGLAALDQAATDRRLPAYQPYWAARGKLLADLGASDAARDAYARALRLATDPAVRAYLESRLCEL